MSVSVAWLLAQKPLELTQVGGPVRGTHPISFVHATELIDPSPWLSGGELVLTTGLGLASDTARGTGYARRLRDAGVACLGFGSGLSHSTVPESLLAEADKVGLPVVEVPYPTPFAAVVRAVMSKIAEQQYDEVLRAAKVQARITRAALRGGVDALVRELAVSTGTDVAYIGARAESVYPADAHAVAATTRSIVAARQGSEAPSSMSVSEPGRTLTVQPVGLSHATAGHLAMVTSGPITGVEQVLLGHAVSLLTLEAEKPARMRAEQTRLHSLATALLLDGRFDGDTFPDYIRNAGDHDGRVRVVAVVSAPEAGVVEHVDDQLAAAGRESFVRQEDGTVSILLRGDDDTDFARSLLPDHVSVRGGISDAARIEDVRSAFEQARLCLGLATTDFDHRLMDFRGAQGSLLLTSEPARNALAAMAMSTVGRLAEHDGLHGEDLLPSLRAYLEANGQWETAASRLGVHRHTLRGRVNRAAELLAIDLGNARIRAEMLLTILAVDTQQPRRRAGWTDSPNVNLPERGTSVTERLSTARDNTGELDQLITTD